MKIENNYFNSTRRIVDSFNNKKIKNNNNGINKSYSSKSTTQIFEYSKDQKILFNLVRSRRRKTSELIIENENEITLRVPFDKPMEEINEIIQKKIQWILRKQDEIRRIKPEIQEYSYSYLPNSKLPYLGNDYEIEIRNVDSSSNINNMEKVDIENNNKLIFYLKYTPTEYNQYESSLLSQSSDIDILKNKIKNMYEKWLYEQSQIIFKEKINEFSKIIDVIPKDLQIKRLKNRWGSVTKNEKIVLNVNLVKTPQKIVDYIIKHELCHFKIEGHSHYFWEFLKNFEPDYDSKIKWLAINGKNILKS